MKTLLLLLLLPIGVAAQTKTTTTKKTTTEKPVPPPPPEVIEKEPNLSSPMDYDVAPPPPPAPPKQEPDVYTIVDEYPEFPGGTTAMREFLAKNLVYPQTALEQHLEGKCYLQFIVAKDGTISNIKVARGVNNCPECDKEAIRVVKMMPKWTPGKVNGKAVNSQFNLPVAFKINEPAEK